MMATHASHESRESEGIPTEIDADGSKLVYFFLDVRGAATVAELSESLGMTKLSLYSILDTLSTKELVEGDGWTYETAA
jgi:predicted transcriptional regulator